MLVALGSLCIATCRDPERNGVTRWLYAFFERQSKHAPFGIRTFSSAESALRAQGILAFSIAVGLVVIWFFSQP